MISITTDDHSMEAKAADEELLQRYNELSEQYKILEEKYSQLSKHCTALQKENEELKQSKNKAGRKPNDEKWTARYQAFVQMKQNGCKREQIQQELNMSRATYFRYNKVYTEGEHPEILSSSETVHTATASESAVSPVFEDSSSSERSVSASIETSVREAEEILAKVEKVLAAPSEGLVQDPETGEYVTAEGLRRRRKLAEIRARRAAEEQLRKQQEESARDESKPDETGV